MVICTNCDKEIGKREDRTRISTFFANGKQVDEWFHFRCWQDYFNECVKKRTELAKKKAMEMFGGTLKQVQGMIGKI